MCLSVRPLERKLTLDDDVRKSKRLSVSVHILFLLAMVAS